jgi:hypothetical protein
MIKPWLIAADVLGGLSTAGRAPDRTLHPPVQTLTGHELTETSSARSAEIHFGAAK